MTISRVLLSVWSWLRYLIGFKINQAKLPENYILVFNETFSNLNQWYLGEGWGEFHPDFPHQYTGKDERFVYTENNEVVLCNRNISKTFYKKDLPYYLQRPHQPDEIIIPYGRGLIVSQEVWQYGWFEIDALLPNGKNLSPAIWMFTLGVVPTNEIDLIEAYSHKRGDYSRGMFKYSRLQPNIHYGVPPKSIMGVDRPIKNCTSKYVKYVCHWTPDFIRIYYDGLLVVNEKRPEVLNNFNKNNAYMAIYLNASVHAGTIPEESEFKVKNVKVYQSTNDI